MAQDVKKIAVLGFALLVFFLAWYLTGGVIPR